MADPIYKWEHQDFFCRKFSSQRTCVSNFKALTLTQPKIKVFKIMACALMSMQRRSNFSNISWGIIGDNGQLFTE